MICHVTLVMCLLAAFSMLESATADSYSVERAVMSGIGGTASGGPFRLDFTIGQSNVGTLSGGLARANAGFWWEVSGNTVDVREEPLPTRFALDPSVPNPFQSHTTVRYAIPSGDPAPVFLGIYDLRGALIKTLVHERRAPGVYSMNWDGRSKSGQIMGAGIYFLTFEGPGFRQHRRVVVLR